jgi:hypothetical protein
MFHFFHLHHHHSPPVPAHIYALDVHIRYHRNRRRHTVATVTLTWTAPTTRVDGSPLAPEQIAGTHIFDGTSEIGAAQGAANTFTTGVLPAGEQVFTVVVHDTDGNASAPSNAAAATIASAAPAAVSDLKVTVNA